MVKNNIEVDVKVKCIESGQTQAQLAEKVETTSSYVNRIIKKKDGVVNKTFVRMLEVLGYDVEIKYVKKEKKIKYGFTIRFLLGGKVWMR